MNEKKHNYFYKITNSINGKFYYGIRSVNKLPDNHYMGSGTAIKQAIKKYGKENFIKEIIVIYPTRLEVSNHEKLIVTISMITDPMCYNCKTGGDSNFTRLMSDAEKQHRRKIMPRGENHHSFGKELSEETKQQISKTLSGLMVGEKHWTFSKPYPETGKQKISEFNIGKTYSLDYKQNMSEKLTGLIVGENHAFFGKHHTDKSRKSIGQTAKDWNKKAFLHIKTNQLFQTRKEVREYFEITQCSVRNWILTGRLQLIDKK